MGRLTGKVALITGAAGGQGTAEAELFLREEAAVVLTDIDAAAGESLAQRLGGEGGKVLFLRQDVADEGSWKEVVAATLARFGKLHILVNNAGTIARQGITETTVEAWNRTLAVNLTGPMLGMKPDRADARHEALRAGDPRQRRRLDHQYILDRRADRS